ncbi:hypothetical protein RAS1_08540 [Phycisphaerae bacterium RAS1]|nr:hypothetical protein RAS1_08540 [Phycisphaerae bacterium RAS1]
MIEYDLTATPLAQSDEPTPPPLEAELLAITVALLLSEGRSYSDLSCHSVSLTRRNHRRVAELIEEHTPTLAREFPTRIELRKRLQQLVGLRITRPIFG